MYRLEHLLGLLTIEKAKELQFRAGSPPILVSESEQHLLQGPLLTSEDLLCLFRGLASSRQMRELKAHGTVQFVHTFPNRSPFLVRARIEQGEIVFDVS